MLVYYLSDDDNCSPFRKGRIVRATDKYDALEYFKSVVGKKLTFDEPSNGDPPAYWLCEEPRFTPKRPTPVYKT